MSIVVIMEKSHFVVKGYEVQNTASWIRENILDEIECRAEDGDTFKVMIVAYPDGSLREFKADDMRMTSLKKIITLYLS